VGFELYCKRGIAATLIEPRDRKLNKAQRKFFEKRAKDHRKAAAARAASDQAGDCDDAGGGEGGGGEGGGGGDGGGKTNPAAVGGGGAVASGSKDATQQSDPTAHAAAAAVAATKGKSKAVEDPNPNPNPKGKSKAVEDPNPNPNPKGKSKAIDAKYMQQLCPHMQECFDTAWCDRHANLLKQVSLIAAMHPDEATEDIVDAAVAMRKPFAVVPCCVFPKLGGRMSYSAWVEYLKAKHPSIQTAFMNFKGKNMVVYSTGYGADSTPPAPVMCPVAM
jgi:hypothetical protein